MTYPPRDDRLRHLIAQEINPHVASWKLAFFVADGIVTSREVRGELKRIAEAHAAGEHCGDRNCEHCWTASVTAEDPAPPSAPADRAALLADEAALIELHCPDHGPQDQDGVWMDCHCPVAEDMRKRAAGPSRMADEAQQPASTAPLAANLPLVKGRCPACNGASLFLGDGGYVTCSRIDCPEPDAASTALEQSAVGAQQPETQAENPARIDGLRPEFTDHASVESIDVQLRRARSQLRRWHLRVEWLISLRQARLEQKERGEWPAAVSQPVARQADTAGEQQ